MKVDKAPHFGAAKHHHLLSYHTRLALDLLGLVLAVIVGLLVWESTWPSKEDVRQAALTKPTIRIIRTKKVARKVAGQTLMIEKDVAGYGTGTIVAREGNAHFALTNHHVVAGNYFGLYADSPQLGGRCEATILKSDKVLDLALVVFFSDRRLPPVAVASESPVVTSTIWCCGYGGGEGEQRVTRGILSRKSFPNFGVSIWMVDCAGWFGDSGGGAYNDRHELIGVPRLMRGGTLYIAPGQLGIVPLPVIRKFLGKLGFVEKISRNPGETHFCLSEEN